MITARDWLPQDLMLQVQRQINNINFYGLKIFGAYWPVTKLYGLYPGVVANFSTRDIDSETTSFLQEGKSYGEAFDALGLRNYARKNNNICTFFKDNEWCIYQTNNKPIAIESSLEPASKILEGRIGRWAGTLSVNNPMYIKKRAVAESAFNNVKFSASKKAHVAKLTKEFINANPIEGGELSFYCMRLVAFVNSNIPGIVDLNIKPLSTYLDDKRYGQLLLNYLTESAKSLVAQDPKYRKQVEEIKEFVYDILNENLVSINQAPSSNFFRHYIAVQLGDHSAHNQLTLDHINALKDYDLLDLANMIFNIYDTTGLTLSWVIYSIESHPEIRDLVLSQAQADSEPTPGLTDLHLIVMESMRLYDVIPDIFSRPTIAPSEISVEGEKLYVPKGVRFFIDRGAACHDPQVFPNPENFDLQNIRARLNDESTLSSILSRNETSFNGLALVNSIKNQTKQGQNPRRCPASVWAVTIIAELIDVIYCNYNIELNYSDATRKPGEVMRIPKDPFLVTVTPKAENNMSIKFSP